MERAQKNWGGGGWGTNRINWSISCSTTGSLAEPYGTGKPKPLLLLTNEPSAWLGCWLVKPLVGGVPALSLECTADSFAICFHPPTCSAGGSFGKPVGLLTIRCLIFDKYTSITWISGSSSYSTGARYTWH